MIGSPLASVITKRLECVRLAGAFAGKLTLRFTAPANRILVRWQSKAGASSTQSKRWRAALPPVSSHAISLYEQHWHGRILSPLVNVIVLGLLLVGAAHGLVQPLHAAERHWTGNANNLWSNPNNWDPVGTPEPGEDLIFTSGGGDLFNDLVGVVAHRVFFHTHQWQLTGNEVAITHSFDVGELNDNSRETIVTIDCPLRLEGSVTNITSTISWGQDDPVVDNPNHVQFRGPIDLNGHNLRVNAESCGCGVDQSVSITGVISGNGNVTLQSAFRTGILEVGGPQPNTFVGTLACEGAVTLDKEIGPVVNTTLEVSAPVYIQRSGQIAPSATVRIAPEGQLRLQGHDETCTDLDIGSYRVYGGNDPAMVTDMQGATLTLLGNLQSRAFSGTSSLDPVTPILAGRLALADGPHTFDIYQSAVDFYGLDVQAEITGAGGFTKMGDAALLLRTNNTFAGSASVDEGIVEVRNAQAFGTTTRGVTLTDGSITLNNVIVNGETLFVRGTRSVTANTAGSLLTGLGAGAGWYGRIELDTNLVVNSSDLCLLGGPIVGSGGLEFLGSRNQMVGSGSSLTPSTYTGLTRVLCELLVVSEERAFRGPVIVGGGFGGPSELRWDFPSLNRGVPQVTVHPNGLVNLNGRAETFTQLDLHGGRVITGTGFVAVAQINVHPTNVTASIEGNLVLGSFPTTEFDVGNGSATPDLAVSAVIEDGINSIGIVKAGDGEMLLSGANTYKGITRVDAGVLQVQNASALGTAGIGTTVLDGGTLDIEMVPALAEPLNLRGTGRGGTLGALFLGPATGTQGDIVLADATTVRNDTSFAILSSVISGTGPLTKTGAGALQFGGGSGAPNTYSGDTIVAQGVLVGSKGDGVTTVPGHLIIGSGMGSATFQNFGSFTIVGSVTVNGSGLWDLLGHAEGFSIPALEGHPPLTLNGGGDVQTGAGIVYLPVGGDVVVAPGTVLGNSSISGNLGLDPGPHHFIVQNGINIIGLDIPELDVSATISETSTAADLVKEGPGEMRLSGGNSFTGNVTVNQGTLIAAHALALGTSAGGTVVSNNAALALDGGIEVADESLTLDTTNAAALLSLGAVTNVWSGPVSLQWTAGILVPDPQGVLTHSGIGSLGSPGPAISGPGGFTKSGPGSLFITGLIGGNSYTGPTTITEGLLEATRGGRSLSSNIVVTGSNSVLHTGRAGNLFNSVFTVLPTGASVTVEDGARWTMNLTNSETLSQLTGDGQLETGTGGTLTISNAVSCVFSGQVSGSGAFSKRGPATFQVTSPFSYNYTGPATVFDGTYKVDGDFRNSPVTVKPAAILRGSGGLSNVTVEAGGVVKVDERYTGVRGGVLGMSSVNFQPSGGVLSLDFFGPDPTGGNDYLYVNGPVTLGNVDLSAGFLYPPHEGDVVTLIDKVAVGAVSGMIGGFPEGSVQMIGNIPVVVSYVGGDGNDVTLTVTNLPLGGADAQVVSGNLGSVLVPDDCSLLSLVVTNGSAATVRRMHGTLRSLTETVVVTIPEADFPDLAPEARGTNVTPFQIRTTPAFPCGGSAQLELVLTGSNFPPTAILYTLLGASGFALDLDGRNDEVDVAPTTFTGIVNNFTIELWANPAGNRSETAETNNGISGVSAQLRQIQRFAVFPDQGGLAYGANHVGAGLSIGRNGISAYEHGNNYLPSRLVYSNALSGWTHVALVYASRRPQLYVNGVLERSTTVLGPFPNIHPSASLGGSTQAAFGNFEGQLDEVRIWNVAFTQEQIQSNMLHRLTGDEPNLITYFRCDEGGGSLLTDSAAASPDPEGMLANGAAFILSDRPTGCDPGGGQCECCFFVSGTFTPNTPTLTIPLAAEGSPSLCFPPKLCPGPFPLPLPPTPFHLYSFTNTSSAEACVTAQPHFECPVAPRSALHAAAYLGEVDSNNPRLNYLGDSGGDGTAAFSFPVPAGSNFVIVVTLRAEDVGCDDYQLELFGLPCPPPTLAIEREADPGKVRVHWSTAYPGWTAQSARNATGSYTNVPLVPAVVNGRYALTNLPAAANEFFRLRKP